MTAASATAMKAASATAVETATAVEAATAMKPVPASEAMAKAAMMESSMAKNVATKPATIESKEAGIETIAVEVIVKAVIVISIVAGTIIVIRGPATVIAVIIRRIAAGIGTTRKSYDGQYGSQGKFFSHGLFQRNLGTLAKLDCSKLAIVRLWAPLHNPVYCSDGAKQTELQTTGTHLRW